MKRHFPGVSPPDPVPHSKKLGQRFTTERLACRGPLERGLEPAMLERCLLQWLPSGGNLDIVAILRSERDRVARQLEGLNAALAAFAGSYVGKTGGQGRGRLSAAARAKIAAAQRARWAKLKGEKGQKLGASATTGGRRGKRTMSAAAKAKIAAAQRARWARVKRDSKSK